LSPSFVVYDELGFAPDRKLYDAMDSAQGAREPVAVGTFDSALGRHGHGLIGRR
jgi:hypothetical protein